MNTTAPTPNGRGCGTRSAGGTYLCLGIGIGGTLKVEDLILDPVKIWPGKWQRGFKILANKNGWNDVAIFVGESFYASPQDFIEEAKLLGISRKVPPTFPFQELTPGKSQMIFFHAKAYPKFDSFDSNLLIDGPLEGCKFFPKSDSFGELSGNWELWEKTFGGWHPKIEKETFCTFAHQHYAGLIHDSYCDNEGNFEIQMPSFSYIGVMPAVRNDDKGNRIELEWQIGAFMAAPISHIEMPKKLNTKAAERANKAGYEAIVTEF